MRSVASGPGAVMSFAGLSGGSSQVCFLAAGQAAHLTVLCARLVHEGAVKAGPHS